MQGDGTQNSDARPTPPAACTPRKHGPHGRATAIVVALAGALAALVLWPLLDNPGLHNTDELQLLAALRRGVPWFWPDVFLQFDGLFYRPLGYVAFCAHLTASDGGPPWLLGLGVAHHAVNCALFGLVAARLGMPGAAAAVLMLVLPTSMSGACWSAAIYDRLLVTFWFVAALLLCRRGRAALLAVPVLAVSLLCKETSVVGPMVLAFVVEVVHRGDREAIRGPRRAVAVAVALALAFAVFRIVCRAEASEYPLDLAGAPTRLGRFVAFPFTLEAVEPVSVRGNAAACIGIAAVCALGGLGLWRRPRATLVAAAACLLPLAPIAPFGHLGLQYLYPATPGFVALCWAALVPVAPLRTRPRVLVAALPAALALGALLLHTHWIAGWYRDLGRALANLDAAYRELDGDEVLVTAAPGPPAAALARYAAYVELDGLRPALRIGEPDTATLTIDADGSVHR